MNMEEAKRADALEQERIRVLCENNNALLEAACTGNVAAVKRILASAQEIHPEGAAWIAVANGDVAVVSALISDPRFRTSSNANLLIRDAANYNYVSMIEMLLADHRFDPADYENAAVECAAHRGHLEAMCVLLKDPRVNPLGTIPRASSRAVRLLAVHPTWGIHANRHLYVRYRPAVVKAYDTMIAQCMSMAWLAKQQRIWQDMVEPLTYWLRAGFFE
jgi:hypothetical protein